MNAAKFLDTNILLYAYDLGAAAKRATALKLVQQGWSSLGQIAISVQVLQELHVNLCKRGLPLREATQIVRDYAAWPIVDDNLELLQAGLDEQIRWQISLWDSLILAAARASGASELMSEDFSHGQNYNGICVVNPFV